MNKTYKVVWSEAKGTWVAVSEITKNHGKTKSRTGKLKKIVATIAASWAIAGASPISLAAVNDSGFTASTRDPSISLGSKGVAVDISPGNTVANDKPASYEVEYKKYFDQFDAKVKEILGGTYNQSSTYTETQLNNYIAQVYRGLDNLLGSEPTGTSNLDKVKISAYNKIKALAQGEMYDSLYHSVKNGRAYNYQEKINPYKPSGDPANSYYTAIGKSLSISTNSTAIGNSVKTEGVASIGIGNNIQATGTSSISIGSNANSKGVTSITIGNEANAENVNGIAVGTQSKSSANGSIAIGHRATAGKGGSVHLIRDNPGNRLFQIVSYGDGIADNADIAKVNTNYKYFHIGFGQDIVSQQDEFTTARLGIYQNDGKFKPYASQGVAIGSYSHTSRGTSLGDATSSNSLGVSVGSLAISEGVGGISIGPASFGAGNSAITVGRQASTSSDFTIALGANSYANSTGAISLGHSASALGHGSIAIGASDFSRVGYTGGRESTMKQFGTRYERDHQTKALGFNSIALGSSSSALSSGATIVGSNSNIANNAIYGSIVGYDSKVSGISGSILGTQSLAQGNYSTVMGSRSEASGEESVVVGTNSFASANYSVAIGSGSQAGVTNDLRNEIKNASNVLYNAGLELRKKEELLAEKLKLVSEKSNKASKIDSAVGAGLNNNDFNKTENDKAIVETNTAVDEAVLLQKEVVAARQKYEDAKKALQNLHNKTQNVNAIAIGKNSVAANKDTISIGTGSVVKGNQSIAVGFGHRVNGNFSGAFGDPNTINGDRSFTTGNNNTINSNSAFAIGSNITIDAGLDGSVVLGADSTTGGSHTVAKVDSAKVNVLKYSGFKGGQAPTAGDFVSIGKVGKERKIINLSAGNISKTSTEAINGSQLWAVADALGNVANTTANHLGGSSKVDPNTGKLSAPSYTIFTGKTDAPNEAGSSTTQFKAPVNNVGAAITTLNDYVNQGFNVQQGGATKGVVTPGENVNFVDGLGTTVNVNNEVGSTTTIKYDVKINGNTLKVDENGLSGNYTGEGPITVNGNVIKFTGNLDGGPQEDRGFKVSGGTGTSTVVTKADNSPTITITGKDNSPITTTVTDNGGSPKVAIDVKLTDAPTATGTGSLATLKNPTGLVNGTTLVNAINSAAHKVATTYSDDAIENDEVSEEEVKAGSKITFEAGKNLKVKHNSSTSTIAFALDKNVDLKGGSITVGDVNNPVVINEDGINAGNKTITNVANGTNPNDAVNVSQLNATKTYVKAKGDFVTVTPSVNATTKGSDFAVSVKKSDSLTVVGGKTSAPTNDGFVTGSALNATLSQVGFNVIANKTGNGTNDNGTNTETLVKFGETVEFIAGDNVNIAQNGKSFTISAKIPPAGTPATPTPVGFKVAGNDAAVTKEITTDEGKTPVLNIAGKDGSPIKTEVTDGTGGPKVVIDVNVAEKVTPNATGKLDEPTGDNGNKLVNATTLVDAINKAAHKVATSASGKTLDDNSGKNEAGANVAAGDKVTFDAGKNLLVKQDNQNITFALAKDINVTSVTFGDNANSPKISSDGGDNLKVGGGDPIHITNVKSNFDDGSASNFNPTSPTEVNNAATVFDVLNAGWNLKGNGAPQDFVRHGDTVNFTDGNATTVVIDSNPLNSNVSINVNVDDTTIKVDGNKLKANISPITNVQNAGNVETANTNSLATAGDVVKAINNSYFTVNSGAAGGTNSGKASTPVKANDEVKFIAGNGVTIAQAGKNFTFSVNQPTTPGTGGDYSFSVKSGDNEEFVNKNATVEFKPKDAAAKKLIDVSLNSNNGNPQVQFEIKTAQSVDATSTGQVNTNDALNKTGVVTNTALAETINNSFWRFKASADQNGSSNGTDQKIAKVKPGNLVDYVASNNIDVSIDERRNKLTFKTKADVKFNSVQFGDNGPKINKGNDESINVGDKNGAPVNITNVKEGTKTYNAGDATGLADLGTSDGNNAVNVNDLKKLGWIVSSDKTTGANVGEADNTRYVNQVTNAKEVKFVGTGSAVVSGKTNGDVRTITVHVEPTAVETTKVVENTTKAGTVKVENPAEGSKLVNATTVADAINTAGWVTKLTDGNSEVVNAGDKLNYVDGKGTVANVVKKGDDVEVSFNVANTTLANNPNGSVKAPETANATKFVNAGDLANTLNNLSYNVTIGTDDTTFANQEGKKDAKVKAGDTLTFKAGKNLIAKQEESAITFALDKDVNLGNDGSFKVGDTNNPITINKDGIDMGGKNITDLANGTKTLDGTTRPNGNPIANNQNLTNAINGLADLNNSDGSNAVNVNDLKKLGWVVSASGNDYAEKVLNADQVDFVGADGVTVKGETKDGVRTITVGGQFPVVYTKADGTKVYKQPDGKFNTSPDGKGEVVEAGDVIASMNAGDNTTTTPTTLANVKGTLNRIGSDENTVTNAAGAPVTVANGNKEAPNTADEVKGFRDDANVINNAATVGDVLNSGWNLQGNGEAKDFVRHADTVNFVNGNGSTVVIKNDDGITSEIRIDTPLAYVGNDGKTTTGDKPNAPTNTVTLVGGNPDAPVTLTNVANGTVTYNDGSSKKDLANLDAPNTGNNAVNVNDLKNLGWIVSSDKTTEALTTPYNATVTNAKEVKFVGTGSAVVSGKTDGDVRTITVDVNAQSVTNNAQFPVVYTKADGTKVYKHPTENKFTTKPDGQGDEVDAGDVIASMNSAANSTTAPTTLANVKGTLNRISGDNNTVTTPLGDQVANGADVGKVAPDSADRIKDLRDDKVIANSSATVGDVLNSGWNLQGNGEAKDFVRHGDTINFVNGTGSTVKIESDGFNSTIRIDTPLAYVGNDGNTVDNNGKPNAPTNTVTLVGGDTNAPVTLTNVANGTNVLDGSKRPDGSNIVNNPNLTKAITGLADLNNSNGSNAVNVNDLKKLGWVVSASGNDYADKVLNADQVDFVGTGLAIVKGETKDGIRKITVDVNAQSVTNNAQLPVVYTKADGTKVYKHPDNNTFTTQPNGQGDVVDAGDVIASMNSAGDSTTAPTTLNNVKGTLNRISGDNTTVNNPTGGDVAGKDGTTAPNTADEIKGFRDNPNVINNAATVGDVLNSGWNLQGNGEAKDFVRHGDTINFVNGTGSTVKIESDGFNSTIRIDTPLAYVGADNKTVDGNNKPNAPTNTVTLVGGDTNAPVTLTNVANGTGVLDGTKRPDGTAVNNPSVTNAINGLADLNAPNTGNNAVNVNDLKKLGWVVSASGNDYADKVGNADQVDFKGEGAIKVTGETKDGVREIKVSLDMDNISNHVNKNLTGNITNNPDGTTATNDGDKLATVKNVSDAINNSGWTIKGAENYEDTATTPTGTTGLVKPSGVVIYSGGNGTTAKVEMDKKDGDYKVSFNVNKANYGANLPENTAYVNEDGKAVAKDPANGPKADNSYLTAADTVNLVNAVSFNVTAGKGDQNFFKTSDNKDVGAPIKAGEAINYLAGKNVEVKRDGQNITYATSADVDFNNVNINEGLTVKNGAKVDMGGNKITNVATGTDGTDAVNVDQLNNAINNLNLKGTATNVVSSDGSVVVTGGDGANNAYDLRVASHIVEGARKGMTSVQNVVAGSPNVNTYRSGDTVYVAVSENPVFQNTTTNTIIVPGNNTAPIIINNGTITGITGGRVAPNSFDAVNGAQLYSVAQDVAGVRKEARGGIAAAMASAGLPQVYLPGKSLIAGGVSTYRGKTGYALGISSISDGGNWIIKGTVSGGKDAGVGASAAIGYQW